MSSKHGNERLLKSTSGYNYEANSGTSQFLLEEPTEDEYETCHGYLAKMVVYLCVEEKVRK